MKRLLTVTIILLALILLVAIGCFSSEGPIPGDLTPVEPQGLDSLVQSVLFSTSNDTSPPGDWSVVNTTLSGSVTLDGGSYQHASGTTAYSSASTISDDFEMLIGSVITTTFSFRYTGDLENCLSEQRSGRLAYVWYMNLKCDPSGVNGDAGTLLVYNETSNTPYSTSTTLAPSTWYELTIAAKVADSGWLKVWVDGSLEIEVSGIDMLSGDLQAICYSALGLGPEYYVNLGGTGYTVWIDDVQVDSEGGDACIPTGFIIVDYDDVDCDEILAGTPYPVPTYDPNWSVLFEDSTYGDTFRSHDAVLCNLTIDTWACDYDMYAKAEGRDPVTVLQAVGSSGGATDYGTTLYTNVDQCTEGDYRGAEATISGTLILEPYNSIDDYYGELYALTGVRDCYPPASLDPYYVYAAATVQASCYLYATATPTSVSATATPTPTRTPTRTPTGIATSTPTATATPTAFPTEPYGDATPTPHDTPTVGPTPPLPTPTPGEIHAYITEVLSTEGDSCADWNLRNRCGTGNDEFVEILTHPYPASLSGWTVDVEGCTYTFRADNLSGPLKVIWADMTTSANGQVCAGFPRTGMAKLYDADSILQDVRVYTNYALGYSWQAAAWTNPGGVWVSDTPNPGRGGGNTVWLTATPSPTYGLTPTPTSTPTHTPTVTGTPPTATPTPTDGPTPTPGPTADESGFHIGVILPPTTPTWPVGQAGMYCNSCGSSSCRTQCDNAGMTGMHYRFEWCALMPSPGVYDVSPILNWVTANYNAGLRSVVGIIGRTDRGEGATSGGSCTSTTANSPSWMLVPGSIYSPLQNGTGSDTLYFLNYKDADVQAAFRGLLQALDAAIRALPLGAQNAIDSFEVDFGMNGEMHPARNVGAWKDTGMYGCNYSGYTWHPASYDQYCTDGGSPTTSYSTGSTEWRDNVIKKYVDIWGQELGDLDKPMSMIVTGQLYSVGIEKADACTDCGGDNVIDYAFNTYGMGAKSTGIVPDAGNGNAEDEAGQEYRNWWNVFKLKWPERFMTGEHGVNEFNGLGLCCNSDLELYWATLAALDYHLDQTHFRAIDYAQVGAGATEAKALWTRYAGKTYSDTPDVWIVLRDTEGTYYPDGANGAALESPRAAIPAGRYLPNYEWFIYQRNPQTYQVKQMSQLPLHYKSMSARSDVYYPLQFNIDDDWPYAGSCSAFAVAIDYLDIGTDNVGLRYKDGVGATVEETWAKTNTGTWATKTYTGLTANFDNNLSSGSDFELYSPDSTADVFHRVRIERTGTCS